jgi:site-specific recombinase XerD
MKREESPGRYQAFLQRRFPDRRTSKDYISDLKQFMQFCAKEWREITMNDIDAYVDEQRQKGLKNTTINRRVASLKTFFDFLAEESGDLSWPNPVRFKRHGSKRGRKLPRDLRDEDVEKVWNVIHEVRDRAWFAVMLRGGLRVGELVGLQLQDVVKDVGDHQPARLRVRGKGDKERLVLLSEDAYAVLAEWLQVRPACEHKQVFLSERNRPLSTSGIEWLLKGYGEQAGVKLTPHQLRHTYARQLTEARMPVTSLSKLMGHSQVSTTQIYTAGADPDLYQAYQAALSARPALTAPSAPTSPSATPVPEGPASLHVERPAPPPLPDLDAWCPDLPAEIRRISLDYVRRQAPTWKPSYRRLHAQGVLSILKGFWNWQLKHRAIESPLELTLADLRAFQSDSLVLGLQNTSINRRLDYIMGILHHLADQGQPVDNSIFRLRILPRPESLPRHLDRQQSQALEDFLQSKLTSDDLLTQLQTAILYVLLHTGIRLGECSELQVQDLNLPAGRLLIRQDKGHKDRVVYLSDKASLAISHYLTARPLDAASPLWVKPNGKVVSHDAIATWVAVTGQAIGVPDLSPHRLRHTLATRLLNAGMDVTQIQRLLGHDLLTTTMIYARVYDTTVETHYRKAMRAIELKQMPLSISPLSAPTLFASQAVNANNTLDDSV